MNGKVARLAALAALLALGGCGGAPYDSQACVENALRRNPDPALLPDAAEQISAWCQTGDAASCSTLGVMYELGLGVRADRARAARLYRHACSDGNARACDNLGGLAPPATPRPATRAPAEVARTGSPL
jgi:TPR repeat protein